MSGLKTWLTASFLLLFSGIYAQQAINSTNRNEIKSAMEASARVATSIRNWTNALSAARTYDQARQAMEAMRNSIAEARNAMSELEKKVDALAPLSEEENVESVKREIKQNIFSFLHQMTTVESRLSEMEKRNNLFAEGVMQRYMNDIISSVQEAEDEMTKMKTLTSNL